MLSKKELLIILGSILSLLLSFTVVPWMVFVTITPLLYVYGAYKDGDIVKFLIVTACIFSSSFTALSFFNPEIGFPESLGYGLIVTSAFGLFALSDKIIPNRLGFLTLIIYITGMEYMALRINPSFSPYLLGSTLQGFPELHRWSSYTGLTGVSAWILLSNILLYPILFSGERSRGSRLILLIYSLMILGIPVIISLFTNAEALTPLQVTREMIRHNESPGSYPAEIFGRTCGWVGIFLLLYALVKLRIKKR